jgi:UDP-N-acetylglucosamine 2-epimerase (non-hydrolysing)
MLALKDLADRFPDVEVVFPVHRNPQVREPAQAILGGAPRVHLIPPLPYGEFANLLARCHLVLTDSGGLQEEAPALGKPVLVLREKTERPEGVAAGTVRLAGTRRETVLQEAERLLVDSEEYGRMARAVNPYGDGMAAARIHQALLHYFGLGERPLDFRPGEEG